MQIKEVKILGFQSETAKMTLTYQVTKKKQRYIIRDHRRILDIYPADEEGLWKARSLFKSYIYNDINQLQLNI